jgi:hypothetical protein
MKRRYCSTVAALVAALALGTLGATSALAVETPEWFSSTTKPVAEWQQSGAKLAAPEWRQGGAALTETVTTKSKGKVKLIDAKEAAELECEGAGEGSASAGGAGRVTGLTLSGCVAPAKVVNSKGEEKENTCKEAKKARAEDLPWNTMLTVGKSSLENVITGESGQPGFELECETALGKVSDVCKLETLNTSMTNVSGGVDATFGSEKLKCSLGGSEAGKLESTQLIEATKGAALEATGLLATKSKGKVYLIDAKEAAEVQCEGAGEGWVSSGAAGRVTGLTLSGCVAPAKVVNSKGEEKENTCKEAKKARAEDLPWNTVLTVGEDSAENVITGEAGEPGFEFECETALGKVSDVCELGTLNTSMTNVTGGVDATFGSEKLKCSLGGSEAGRLESTQLIEATKGAALEAKVVEPTYSKVTSALDVKGKGELTVQEEAKGLDLGLTCSVETKGTVEGSGKGTIANYYASACEPKGGCTALDTAEVVNLPWDTELSGATDEILSGGSGTPGWMFECQSAAGRVWTTCYMASPEWRNLLSGSVEAVFSKETKIKCTAGAVDGYWEGHLVIEPESGAALKVKG